MLSRDVLDGDGLEDRLTDGHITEVCGSAAAVRDDH